MNNDRNERIRRAAILVASLDERLAEQMLDNLPVIEAERILEEVERLGEIDADEQRDVLDEFRRAGRSGRETSPGVEFTYSAPQSPMAVKPLVPPVASEEERRAVEAAKTAEAVMIAELLSVEHPQTIAVALSRMDHEQGAAVFAELPPALQSDVIDRLANLQITDETAVSELQTELRERIEVQRQFRERAAAGAEMARKIVSKTTPMQRDTLLARLSPRDAATVKLATLSSGLDSAVPAEPTLDIESAIRVARELVAAQDDSPNQEEGGFEAWADDGDDRDVLPIELPAAMLDDRSRELETLDDAALLRALQQADEQTVYRALACSSEKFLGRVASKLPRRAASQLRQSVRSIGPTRLIEMRAAQHLLLHLAERTTSAAA